MLVVAAVRSIRSAAVATFSSNEGGCFHMKSLPPQGTVKS